MLFRSFTEFGFWMSAGSNYAARASNIGFQSGTWGIWGVQIEVGSVATPLEKPDPQVDLAKCQRFYTIGTFNLQAYGTTGVLLQTACSFPVWMRAAPAITTHLTQSTNINGFSTGPRNDSFAFWAAVTATGAAAMVGTYTASADL